MDSSLEERIGRPGVDVIRGDDGDRLDPVGPLGLGFRHARVIVVDPVGGQTERLARAPRLIRRRRQGAGDELVMIVDARSDAVNRADKGALAAADHPESDPAALVGVAASLDGHARVSSLARPEARARLLSNWLCRRRVAPSVENGGRQGARRPSRTVGPPERKAVQNPEFAVRFVFARTASARRRAARARQPEARSPNREGAQRGRRPEWRWSE